MNESERTQERWNREALASAWLELGSFGEAEARLAGDVEGALCVDGRYPAFQFRPGLLDTVRQVVVILAPVLGTRSILLWFTSSSGWLEGARPVDVLDRDPGQVVEAARYQATLGED